MPAMETEGELKTLPAPMALPFRAPQTVKVRSVWAHNLEKELNLIESLLPSFRLGAVDTEFPGTVHRPSAPLYMLSNKELHLVQLGLTLFDVGGGLPGYAVVFEFVVKTMIGKTLYDVKEMARHCPCDLRGGLEVVADKLGLQRFVGEAHQAGSDSRLTFQMYFMWMRKHYFDDDQLTAIAGVPAC